MFTKQETANIAANQRDLTKDECSIAYSELAERGKIPQHALSFVARIETESEKRPGGRSAAAFYSNGRIQGSKLVIASMVAYSMIEDKVMATLIAQAVAKAIARDPGIGKLILAEIEAENMRNAAGGMPLEMIAQKTETRHQDDTLGDLLSRFFHNRGQ